MALYSYLMYSFLVVVACESILQVAVPVCKNSFIEPSGKGNEPLTRDWFIWGQLYSYCMEGSNLKCSTERCKACLTAICVIKYTNLTDCKLNCLPSANKTACEEGCIFYDGLMGGNSTILSLIPNKVPRLSPNITANVVVNTFNSLTFQWKTSNSTSSNAVSVYLITLRTFNRKMRVEEKVLGLTQGTEYKLTEDNICKNIGLFHKDELYLEYRLIVYPINYHGNGTEFGSEKTVPRRLPKPNQLQFSEPFYDKRLGFDAVIYNISWKYDYSDLNVSQAIQQYDVLRTLTECSQNNKGTVLSYNLPLHEKISPTLSKTTIYISNPVVTNNYHKGDLAKGCTFKVQIIPRTKNCLHGDILEKNITYAGCESVLNYPQGQCNPITTPKPVDDKVKPPNLTSSNFRCMEKITTTCYVNKTYNGCPKCASFTYVNTTTVNCTRCERGVVDILVNWTEPKTFSPIKKYRIQFGPEFKIGGRTYGVLRSGDPLNHPPNVTKYTFKNVSLPVKGRDKSHVKFGVTVHADSLTSRSFMQVSAKYTFIDLNRLMNTLQPVYLPSTDKPKHSTITTKTTVTPPKSKKRSHTGRILGIVFGVMSLLLILIVLFYKRYRGHRQLKFSDPDIGLYYGIEKAIVTDDWEIFPTSIALDEKIGEGAFGTVFSAFVELEIIQKSKYATLQSGSDLFDEKNFKVAVKLLKECASNEELDDFREEIKLMKTIGYHRNIVNLVGCSTIKKPLCLIVEYMPYGDLLHFLRQRRSKLCIAAPGDESIAPGFMYTQNYQDSMIQTNDSTIFSNNRLAPSCLSTSDTNVEVDFLTPDDLISFAWQIACGMEYLSQNNLVHRDLAARNILVGKNNIVKISDFGLTRKVSDEMIYMSKKHRRLPVKWMSVEAIFDQVFTMYSDVWAYGVVLFEIVTLGGTPYPTINNRELLRLLKSGYRMEKPENCAEPMYDIMLHCWNEDPFQRPTFTELREHLDETISAGDKYFTFDINQENTYYNVASFKSVVSENEEDEMVIDELMSRPMQVKKAEELKESQQKEEKIEKSLTPEEAKEEKKLAEKIKELENDETTNKGGRYMNPQFLLASDDEKLKKLMSQFEQNNRINNRYISQRVLKTQSAGSKTPYNTSPFYISQGESTLAIA